MIVVDAIVEYPAEMTTDKGLPSRHWCHLQSTDESPAGEAELIAFGARIGMMSRWLQHPGRPGRVHFDLTRSKRLQAIKLGAVPIDLAAFSRARLTGPEALAAYLASVAPPSKRLVFGVTPPPDEPRGCMDGGGRSLKHG